jgi:hypothetical protein
VLYPTRVVDLFDRVGSQGDNLTRFNPVPPRRWDEPEPELVKVAPGGGIGGGSQGLSKQKADPVPKNGWAAMRTAVLIQAPFHLNSGGLVRPSIASESRGGGLVQLSPNSPMRRH